MLVELGLVLGNMNWAESGWSEKGSFIDDILIEGEIDDSRFEGLKDRLLLELVLGVDIAD